MAHLELAYLVKWWALLIFFPRRFGISGYYFCIRVIVELIYRFIYLIGRLARWLGDWLSSWSCMICCFCFVCVCVFWEFFFFLLVYWLVCLDHPFDGLVLWTGLSVYLYFRAFSFWCTLLYLVGRQAFVVFFHGFICSVVCCMVYLLGNFFVR